MMCIKDNIKQNVPSVRNREQEVLIELLWQVLSGNCVLWTRVCHVLSCLSHASVTNSLGAKQIDKFGLWRSQTQPGAAAYTDIKPYHTIHYSFPKRYSKGSGRGTQSLAQHVHSAGAMVRFRGSGQREWEEGPESEFQSPRFTRKKHSSMFPSN